MSEHIIEIPDYVPPFDPAVRAVSLGEEIVRCRDCKYMHRVRSWLGMDVDECWLHADRESGALGKVDTEPDGFCAWGEQEGRP